MGSYSGILRAVTQRYKDRKDPRLSHKGPVMTVTEHKVSAVFSATETTVTQVKTKQSRTR